ncbi:Arc family DNA-binding protein [Citrobacter portucalensis]|uniref:Arc family DNA-binding protein n=1 Tax=Citrobacter portucalensis TaxID=1639133 RepID=UPI00177AF4D2|nr:Arc family DNA-binding protein [Citrobacter portucalensis]MBD9984609.1 Arc family DNA-binding protein [Citrobacter portucalensis]MBE0031813.1 Arc family DNA-binding protein [Citrobacter portucalensis]MBE0039834.1 Arc family DNA-binding protein [Citrobacter portucalensis]MBE0046788.1 Arc family DNA-binding protein [Citrobacter portucalensis]MBE0076409.1 Arc family DNA-binding protein [Citrobacter portucalensis]
MSKFPSQEMDRFNVRLPAGMRDAIAERAKANGRSMNSEIIQILQDALNDEFSIPKMFQSDITDETNLGEMIKLVDDKTENFKKNLINEILEYAILQQKKELAEKNKILSEEENKKPT